jgi:hypothetical protein
MLGFFVCLQKEEYILHLSRRVIEIRPEIEWKRDRNRGRLMVYAAAGSVEMPLK